jgi:hypothetical protein
MQTRFAAAGAAALAATVAIGCGSSDDGPSKADFLKQGNAICSKGNKVIEAGAKKTFASGSRPSNAQITKFMTQTVIPGTQKQVDDIKALDPPKGDEDKVKAITNAADDAIAKTKANPISGAQEGAKDPFAKANKLANAYGLKACGSS